MAAILALFFAIVSAFGQSGTGTVRGQVTDPSGASVPAITVTALGAGGASRQVQTNEEGRYVFQGMEPGTYSIRIQVKGFADFEKAGVAVAASQVQVVDARLIVALEKQQVTVTGSTTGLSVRAENNASALVLKDKDLESLSDDPDELQSQLQALAGPSAGPNGGEIYIDGFTGGQLPSKSAIREIRVNQNPFSAQYDKLGYGRIEILTKPGQDKFHGQGFSNFNFSALNSRNPFASEEPSYHSMFFDGNIGGALSKKASFFVDGGRRNINRSSVVSATILDSNYQETAFSDAVLNPRTRTNLTPRVDYQLTPNNTLTARYQFWRDTDKDNGIGQLALASQGYDTKETEHTLQISDSQVISTRTVTELRFQYLHNDTSETPRSVDPTLAVTGAFTGGGSSAGKSLGSTNQYELQNLTSMSLGKHYLTFGGRVRDMDVWNSSRSNFNGSFTFSSLSAYQSAEQTIAACESAGGTTCEASGASQFTITSGTPSLSVNWVDLGLYAEDQWRLRPNMSLNLGLRYETQNYIHDRSDLAPRVGFAWGLGHGKSAKTVLRAGFGLFYDRFGESLVMGARQLNGVNQIEYLVTNPDFFPTVPSISELKALGSASTASAVYQIDSGMRAPYTVQSAVGIERQLSKNATVSATYLNSHGVHQLMTRNINAPRGYVYCSSSDTSCAASAGVRPYPDQGNIYQYEASGLFNQNQLISNFNIRAGTKLSLFGFYSLSYVNSNTSGASSFPSDSYDLALDYGRAAYDVRHRVFLGGSISLPKGFRASPFVMVSSGVPFNITTGEDLNGDSVYNDRPSFAESGATGSNIVTTKWGTFNTKPTSGEKIIPIDYGMGPSRFEANLRLSKTFGFGRKAQTNSASGMQGPPRGGGRGGPGGPGGGLGPGGLSGSGGPPPGLFGPAATTRYNLTFSVSARNIFNTVNLGTPVGQLSSPTFGKSNSLASGFFPTGGNRAIDFQVMFSF